MSEFQQGDYVRCVSDNPHFEEKPNIGAIGRVMIDQYPYAKNKGYIVAYFAHAENPVGDYEASYTFEPDEIELVDVAALTQSEASADTLTELRNRIADLEADMKKIEMYGFDASPDDSGLWDTLDTIRWIARRAVK